LIDRVIRRLGPLGIWQIWAFGRRDAQTAAMPEITDQTKRSDLPPLALVDRPERIEPEPISDL
jgi:hypothetical protein